MLSFILLDISPETGALRSPNEFLMTLILRMFLLFLTVISIMSLLWLISETIDLFTFGQLENYLSDILEVKVDLVMKDSLKPRLKDRILNEAVYV